MGSARSSLPKESPWTLGGRAAALSFYLLFALFPTLLFLTAMLALFPGVDLRDRLAGSLAHVLPGEAASMTRTTLGEVAGAERGGLLSMGVLLALWAGSSGMTAVITTLNIAFNIEEPRPWWKRRLVAILLTVGFALFMVSGLALMVFGPRIGGAVAGSLGLSDVLTLAWRVASIPLVIVLVLAAIELVYYLAPGGDQQWNWLTPGAVLALALWLAVSYGLRLYVAYFGQYTVTYGTIGAVILLMLWLYLVALALLLGARGERPDRGCRRPARRDHAVIVVTYRGPSC